MLEVLVVSLLVVVLEGRHKRMFPSILLRRASIANANGSETGLMKIGNL